MRILFLTSTLPRYEDDTQANFVGEQAEAWKSARPTDEIFILAPHDHGAELSESRSGVEIRRFRYMLPAKWQALAYPAILPNLKRRPLLAIQILPYLLSQYFAAARLARTQQIDLVYAHWVMPQGLVAYALNRRLGIPYILQNHSSDLTVFDKFARSGRRIAAAIIRRSQRLFVVNSKQREHALSLFEPPLRDLEESKIIVLPMGVTPPADSPGPARQIDFATISRLSRKKGIDHFIKAAEKLSKSGARFYVTIAGDGEEAERLKSLAADTPISFAGFLHGKAKDQFLNDAKVLVVPSIVSQDDVEGMPVSLLEALCRGKRVIASKDSNIMCLPEWPLIKDLVILLEDPSDICAFAKAMRSSLSIDQAEAIHAEQRLREVMARYLWPNLIESYHDAIPLAR